MKVTLSAAMRARDVSRPRDEQLAEAEAAEASLPSIVSANVSPAGVGRGSDAGDGAREDTGRANAERDGAGQGGAGQGGAGREGGRRRRVPRDAPRRGR